MRRPPPKGNPTKFSKKALAGAAGAVDAPEVEKVGRVSNFHIHEDVILSQAWAATSLRGTSQNRASFWNAVLIGYASGQAKSPIHSAKAERTAVGLMNRFHKAIKTNVLVFNKDYKRAKEQMPPGEALDHAENILKFAVALYSNEESTPKLKKGSGAFFFEDCLPILHRVPKFDPFTVWRVINVDDPPASHLHIDRSGMGDGIQRLIGSRAAETREETDSGVQALQWVSKQVESIGMSLKRNGDFLARREAAGKRKEHVKELSQLFSMYLALGDLARAREIANQLQLLVETNIKARAAEETDLIVPPTPTNPTVAFTASTAETPCRDGSRKRAAVEIPDGDDPIPTIVAKEARREYTLRVTINSFMNKE